MSDIIADLERGSNEEALDSVGDGNYTDELPDDLDLEKFDRGRLFFKKNVSQCFNAMFFSLVCGLSVVNLLEVLVATDVTSKPKQSALRYMRTSLHVLKWHYGNVWNANCSAGKSVRAVREIHNKSRVLMKERTSDLTCESLNDAENADKKHKIYLSQYDMSLVQCGFMGAIIMYAKEFGIHCTKSELEDYVYFWRWLGYLLGIKKENNICYDGYDKAFTICKAIEKEILFPSMLNPHKDFYPMAKAFTDGINMISYTKIHSPESVIALTFEYAGMNLKCPYKITFCEWLRMCFWKSLWCFQYYIPGVSWCMNKLVEVGFGCHRIT